MLIGEGFLSVVDRGWVEMGTGKGSLSRVTTLNTAVTPLNIDVVPLILLVGRIIRVLVYVS